MDIDGHPDLPDTTGDDPETPGDDTPAPSPSPTLTPPAPVDPKKPENPKKPEDPKKPEEPKPAASHCPKGPKVVPPAVVDALVMKYGCVDTSDEGKGSNDKKIGICHVPKGNPKAAHMICVAVPGAVNGHGIDVTTCKSPVGDYCGACK